MIRAALLLLLLALPAQAQVRDFSCVGAEQLDGVAVPFERNRERAATAALDELVARAKEEVALNLCVLGFAGANEGGAETQSRLAARRARFVAQELSKAGIERDRIRAEARTRGFTQGNRPGVQRSPGVRVVLMPVAG